MIKGFKYLLTFIVISLGIINFSSSYYSVGTSVDNSLLCDRNPYGNYSDLPCENTCTINSNLSFSCSSSNNKIIFTNYRNGYQTAYYRTSNGLMRYSLSNFGKSFDVSCGSSNFNSSSNDAVRGFLYTGFQLCEGDYYPNTSPNISACPGSGTVLSYLGMLEYIKNSGGIIGFDFNIPAGNVGDVGLAFIGNGFYFQATVYHTYNNLGNQQFRFGNASLDYGHVSNSCTTGDYKVLLNTSFPNVISNPMRLAGGNYYTPGEVTYNTGEIKSDLDNYIDYYEYRYSFNEKMCYVGTDDLEHSFRYFIGQSVPYEYGSGATLYQLYYALYSGFGSNKIRNLGSFINSWLINYANVYVNVSDDDIRYVAKYNGPDTNVTILYTGYTNELFLGNLGAIYNMASVLYNSFSYESTMGEEIAFYCDMKLNYNSYNNGSLSFTGLVDLVTPGIIDRIGDYLYYDMPGSTGFVSPVLGSGSIWNDIISSGYNIPDDINPTNLFKDYFEKINDLIRNFSPVPNGIIPDWILFPMLFLIFYRIIRH